MKLSSEVREFVRRRAQGACEYCRLPQSASILPLQVDHIIGRQHRGSDEVGNLCLCCIHRNLKKGPNIASVDPETGSIVALYHPRHHSWREHFSSASDGILSGLTIEGRVTVYLLDMNGDDRVEFHDAAQQL